MPEFQSVTRASLRSAHPFPSFPRSRASGVGKAIVNPTQSMSAVFAEHQRDEINRMRASKHRFFEPFKSAPSGNRSSQLESEGFTVTQRESMIIGTVPGRHRLKSIGIEDNFGHTQARYCADDGAYFGHFLFNEPSKFDFEFTLYDELQAASDISYNATEELPHGSLQLHVDTNNSDLIGILKPFRGLLDAEDLKHLKYYTTNDTIYLNYRGLKDVWLTKSLCERK